MPIDLQAKLLVTVSAYDRNMAARAVGLVNILVFQKPADAESVRTTSRLEQALSQFGSIVGMRAATRVRDYSSALALARQVRDESISIVYLTPGMKSDIPAIADALDGVSVLSVSAVPDHAYTGSVLAFDLIEGRPRILVHLGRARAQNVDFKASFLRLAQVVDS